MRVHWEKRKLEPDCGQKLTQKTGIKEIMMRIGTPNSDEVCGSPHITGINPNNRQTVVQKVLLKNPAKRRYVTSVSLFIKILVWGWQNPYLGL